MGFHIVGNLESRKLRLKICARIGERISLQPLIIKLGMPSEPAILEGLRDLIV